MLKRKKSINKSRKKTRTLLNIRNIKKLLKCLQVEKFGYFDGSKTDSGIDKNPSQCSICYENVKRFLTCGETNIICGECLIECLKYSKPEDFKLISNFSFKCSDCEISLYQISQEFDENIMKKALIEWSQITKSNIEHELSIELEKTLRNKIENENITKKWRDKYLTKHCPNPNCNQVFDDFDGCFSVECVSCKKFFCAWCLEYFNDSTDETHRHVPNCPKGNRNIHGTKKEFEHNFNKLICEKINNKIKRSHKDRYREVLNNIEDLLLDHYIYIDNNGNLKQFNDIDFKDENGDTILMKSSAKGNLEIVKMLLGLSVASNQYSLTRDILDNVSKKANVWLCNRTNETALHIALKKNYNEIIKLLIDLQDEKGYTELINSSENNNIEIVKLLLTNKANTNLQTVDGFTSLILASKNGYTEIVRLLLTNKANVDLQTKDNKTALMVAKNNEISTLINDEKPVITMKIIKARQLKDLPPLPKTPKATSDFGKQVLLNDTFVVELPDKSIRKIKINSDKEWSTIYAVEHYKFLCYEFKSQKYSKTDEKIWGLWFNRDAPNSWEQFQIYVQNNLLFLKSRRQIEKLYEKYDIIPSSDDILSFTNTNYFDNGNFGEIFPLQKWAFKIIPETYNDIRLEDTIVKDISRNGEPHPVWGGFHVDNLIKNNDIYWHVADHSQTAILEYSFTRPVVINYLILKQKSEEQCVGCINSLSVWLDDGDKMTELLLTATSTTTSSNQKFKLYNTVNFIPDKMRLIVNLYKDSGTNAMTPQKLFFATHENDGRRSVKRTKFNNNSRTKKRKIFSPRKSKRKKNLKKLSNRKSKRKRRSNVYK